MGEFGHEFVQGTGFHIDSWGTGPFVIASEGKCYRFEDSDRFGPALVNKRGDPLKNPYPGERSPFWRAHAIWRRQGRRTEDDGITCIWDEPKPMLVRRIAGNHHLVVDAGEEDGKVIYLDEAKG